MNVGVAIDSAFTEAFGITMSRSMAPWIVWAE